MATLASNLAVGRLPNIPHQLLVWLVTWVLAPNLIYMLLWSFGSPPRHFVIALTGLVGLLARHWPYAYRAVALVASMLFGALSYIAAIFNLDPGVLLSWVPLLATLHPERSTAYVVGGIALVANIGVALAIVRYDGRFAGSSDALVVAGMLALLFGADQLISRSSSSYYGRFPSDSEPFTSSVIRSGFITDAKPGRHLVMIMTESFGMPRDRELFKRLISPLTSRQLRQRYSISYGVTPYFGSTINGEMRALCGRWTGFADLAYRQDRRCLPWVLSRKGYATTAMHSFDPAMFSRGQVYPNMGFRTAMFRNDLYARGARQCPGMFPGACDRDVPAIISRQLRSARGLQFIYWLTLNSHLPVIADPALDTVRCPPDLSVTLSGHSMICRQAIIWRETFAQIAKMLDDPATPPVDLLIVGDHMPPFFDRHDRIEFDPTDVPWLMLRAKEPTRQ